MPIVFGAIASHSPLLLERVGKTHRRKLSRTYAAYRELERQLYAAKPETMVIASPHGEVSGAAFTLGVAERYQTDFKSFGDFGTIAEWRGDAATAQLVRSADEVQRQPFPLRLSGESHLDHGVGVPLVLLGRHLPALAVIPVHPCGLPAMLHWRFGQFLGDQLRGLRRRIALVASADLSHRLSAAGPAGFSRHAAAFDRQVLEFIRRGDAAAVVNLDAALAQEVACCGFLPLLVLLGALDGLRAQPVVFSYEGPFGVGHLLVNFDLT